MVKERGQTRDAIILETRPLETQSSPLGLVRTARGGLSQFTVSIKEMLAVLAAHACFSHSRHNVETGVDARTLLAGNDLVASHAGGGHHFENVCQRS
jgi:hypothetical protein